MIHAELGRQLMIRLDNKIGSLAEVTSVIAASGINLIAICAYEAGGMVAAMFVTEDNNGSRALLEDRGITVQEEEVILLTVGHKPGALQRVTEKIAEAGIDLNLLYGSVEKDGKKTRLVMISRNNLDVMMLIKTELERGE